jgi:hypothetical protein
MDTDKLTAHLFTILDDLAERDAREAANATWALLQVRRIFRGTPYEAQITEVMVLCDTVTSFIEENHYHN